MTPGAMRALAVALACTCSMTASAEPTSNADAAALVSRDSGDLASLSGVWRSRGYGWLLAIDQGRIDFYDESGKSCIKASNAAERLVALDSSFQVSDDERVLKLTLEDPSYQYTFDKIDALPDACLAAADPSPGSVIDALGDIFSSHYAFFKSRKVNWAKLVGEAKKSVTAETTNAELLEIVKSLISKFDDDHVSLHSELDGRKAVHNTGAGKSLKLMAEESLRTGTDFNELLERWKSGAMSKETEDNLFAGTLQKAANGNVRYGLIGGDIGYLAVNAMDDFADDGDDHDDDVEALDEALDRAMAMFNGASAVIVDVSLNDGGFDTIARRIAGRFAAERTLAYSKYAGDAKGDTPQAIYVEPSDRERFTGPVYLVTSDITVSAAEIFTMAMRALPNVTHLGGTTRGSLSDVLAKPLPNGWKVTLSNEVYLDAKGKAWEG
ncbi:MAG TPA: S41 family peptidase, partial [Methylocystis sp.]